VQEQDQSGDALGRPVCTGRLHGEDPRCSYWPGAWCPPMKLEKSANSLCASLDRLINASTPSP
jgi:hypothetical protein